MINITPQNGWLMAILLLITGVIARHANAQELRDTSDNSNPPNTPNAPPANNATGSVKPTLPIPSISAFTPTTKLKVARTLLTRSKFPSIDVHCHFGRRLRGDAEALNAFVKTMDRHNIAVCVSLDAVLGSESDHLRFLAPHRDRFVSFAHIDFRGAGQQANPESWACNQAGFIRKTCLQLKAAKTAGICGLKFFKQFGLHLKDSNSNLYAIDDPKWDPIWETCGQLDLPVIMHTADPSAFFDPVTTQNERYEELARHPDWSFHGDAFPGRDELLEARNRVIERHPDTKFIGAHLGGGAEELARVQRWLEQYPNLWIEIASRIGELGRQPFTARKFLIKNQDRVLFGTDGPWPELRLTYYWRFLETHDEYFPYSEKRPQPQGLWHIYGVNLPDKVLEKIYFRNACELIPRLDTVYQNANNSRSN